MIVLRQHLLLAGPAPVRKLEQERRVADTQYTLHSAEPDERQDCGGPVLGPRLTSCTPGLECHVSMWTLISICEQSPFCES